MEDQSNMTEGGSVAAATIKGELGLETKASAVVSCGCCGSRGVGRRQPGDMPLPTTFCAKLLFQRVTWTLVREELHNLYPNTRPLLTTDNY